MATQTTLHKTVTLAGVGLHSGANITCRLCPAPVDSGIVFCRTDLPGDPQVPARVEAVVPSQLSTCLQWGEARVQTVEHLLAALVGLGISNCRIEVDGPEVPIGDGSALPWVEAIAEAGVMVQEGQRACYVIDRPLAVWEGDAFVTAMPAREWRYTYGVDFPDSPIRQQWYSWRVDPATFAGEIALARTFVRQRDVAALQRAGLIRGGSLENALVCTEKDWLNPPLRIDREPVRHKLIDLLGDLSLLGGEVQGHVLAYKAGHRLHLQLAQAILQITPVTAVVD
ncbi:MAG: UDP-3-O-acyl-N-acetylglucosamine deacetylase [Thermostichales cyanobacterium SZTDM-1c_bins_54]